MRDERHLMVQCKRWRAGREIGPEVVETFARDCDAYTRRRLSGDQTAFDFLAPRTYGRVFVATCVLSDAANEAARRLGIQVRENYVFPPAAEVNFATCKVQSNDAAEPWDEDAWRVTDWLHEQKRIGATAAQNRAKEMAPLTLAFVMVWSGGWIAAAARAAAWWMFVLTALPWAIHFWGIVSATGPGPNDDFVRVRVPRLRALMKRRREAMLSANAENLEHVSRQEESVRAELAEYFRNGRPGR